STNISEINTIKRKKPWSILFLDDEIDKSHNLIVELEKQVEKVYCVQNVIDAENILKRNVEEGLHISLVVSDYRLFETDKPLKVHQPKQGYKFLMETSTEYPYLGLVAFSSLSRKFLLQSFKRMGMRVDVYSKKDYFISDTTLKILVDEFVDKGNEAFDAIVRLPRLSSPNWKNFEPFYAYHRRSLDYLADEQYISNKAKSYCINHQEGNTFFDLTDYTTELKGKSKTPDNPKFFKEYLEKMICRRSILWYSRVYSSEPINSPKEIIEFLQGTNYNSQMSENTPTNQINTNLALRLTEYPWNTTIEEKEWLINQMGTDRKKIEDVENKENEILSFAEQEIVKLITNQNCQPNTFVNCKMWLSEAASTQNISKNKDIAETVIKIKNRLLKTINSVKTEPPLIQILQDKKIVKDVQCKSILHQYKSLIDLFYYLTRLKNYVENYNNSLIPGDEGADIESIRHEIILKAKKEFLSKGTNDNSNEYDLIASIYDFFGELNKKGEYPKTEAAYYSSFKVFYKEYKYSFSDPYRTVSLDLVSFALKDDDFNEEDYSS
ncbi:MAG: hypothetical protein HF967_05075, partial [Methanosarcinales archaeon]|nr:hypothetical protein [Methanosarcinales archaeon]